jgi:EpsI family protein
MPKRPQGLWPPEHPLRGGWLITDLSTVDLGNEGAPYPVVRTELELKGSRLLVYYWFKQRHRILANEYVMKWYLLLDSLMLNRTDGALVRVTTSLAPGEPMADADARIRAFVETARPVISQYVPD